MLVIRFVLDLTKLISFFLVNLSKPIVHTPMNTHNILTMDNPKKEVNVPLNRVCRYIYVMHGTGIANNVTFAHE